MPGPQVAAGGAVAGQEEHVVAFVGGEPQATGDGREHRLGRLRPVAAFQPGEVVGGHAAQLRDLFPPQPRCAPALPPPEPDVFRLQRRPPGAQEGAEGGGVERAVHDLILAGPAPPGHDLPVSG
ncbi:hypothetical protein H480_43610 [Amycolatopsis vancoresmycina DSM 44592]|uniref:Uncharacterized protein n=1 Tax=Amycolatopsis vancoresmycina DSM 44592 TaxID=1292037 RepID=R1HIW2_9PSEU|nr:hypothetical protein H480_43610 [Amycolatopsis vancoresmycina DSM 44592]